MLYTHIKSEYMCTFVYTYCNIFLLYTHIKYEDMYTYVVYTY